MLSLLKPPPKLNVADWANSHRYIARGTSAEAGKFSCDRLPYQREPMEMLTDQRVGEVVLCWGSQLGKTELLLNTIGYCIDQNPSSVLVVYPTQDSARKFSTKKLAPMLAESPCLTSKVKDPRSRDSGNTIRKAIAELTYPKQDDDWVVGGGQQQNNNRLEFIVRREASKADIKAAVEELLEVRVAKVNTRITKEGKHASVKLAEGYDAEETALKLGAF